MTEEERIQRDTVLFVNALKGALVNMDEDVSPRSTVRAAAWLLSGTMAATPGATVDGIMSMLQDEITAIFRHKIDLLKKEAH